MAVRGLAHGRDQYMKNSEDRHLAGLVRSVGIATGRMGRGVYRTIARLATRRAEAVGSAGGCGHLRRLPRLLRARRHPDAREPARDGPPVPGLSRRHELTRTSWPSRGRRRPGQGTHGAWRHHVPNAFAHARTFARLPGALRRFARQTLTVEEARRLVRERMDNRAENFLGLVERGVYGHPLQPLSAIARGGRLRVGRPARAGQAARASRARSAICARQACTSRSRSSRAAHRSSATASRSPSRRATSTTRLRGAISPCRRVAPRARRRS